MRQIKRTSSNSEKCLDHIKFDYIFIDEILSGRKTSTIRIGKLKYKECSDVYLMFGNMVYGIIHINKIEEKTIDSLTDKDAIIDGFKNKEELLKFLFMLYPNLDLTSKVYIIHFSLKKKYYEPIPLNIARFYKFKDPKEVAEEIIKSGIKLREYDEKIIKTIAEKGLSFAKRKFNTDYYTLHKIIKKYLIKLGYI